MSHRLRSRLAAVAGAAALVVTTAGPVMAVQPVAERGPACVEPADSGSASARGGWGHRDHRDLTAAEMRAIEKRTERILAAKGRPGGGGGGGGGGEGGTAGSIPVYVHVMRDAKGGGDVTDQQIAQQIAVLNATYAGQETSTASNTGFTFTLAGVDRWNNNAWHGDAQSTTYRAKTRLGGANALNMWLVDFRYLGIATFPWDYDANPQIDGVRVHYNSLPGGGILNYSEGETATHEVGHWLGLYHVFQGGCTGEGDQVADTPPQSTATNGCPEGQDSCAGGGLDSIHNYMDYSYDACYLGFTGDQASRMQGMWTAYRA